MKSFIPVFTILYSTTRVDIQHRVRFSCRELGNYIFSAAISLVRFLMNITKLPDSSYQNVTE